MILNQVQDDGDIVILFDILFFSYIIWVLISSPPGGHIFLQKSDASRPELDSG